MEDNLLLITSLQIGETLSIYYDNKNLVVATKQSYSSLWTSFSRYYYEDNNEKTIGWINQQIHLAMLDHQALLRKLTPLLLKGLANLTITYKNKIVVVEKIQLIMEDILTFCSEQTTPLTAKELLSAINPTKSNFNINFALPSFQIDVASLLKLLFYML